jgi:glycosyltransferase involved in cell wall biosynthesis
LASAAALAKIGHDVFYVDPDSASSKVWVKRIVVEVEQGFPVQLDQVGIPCVRHVGILGKLRPVSISPSTLTSLGDIRPTVIISHSEYWSLAHEISKKLHTLLVFYPMTIRARLLFSYHLKVLHKYSSILEAPFSLAHNVFKSYLSDLTIVPGKSEKKVLNSAGARNVFVLHPPYARIYLTSEKVNVDLREPYVLAITSLGRRGNVELDLDMFKTVLTLATNMTDTRFVVVGTSADDLTRSNSHFRVPKNLSLAGKIYDDRTLDLVYKKATCVLCPFKFPSSSNRLLEAFFYSKPIITTRTMSEYYDGLVNGSNCIVEDSFSKWPERIRQIYKYGDLFEKLEKGSRSYYRQFFSPNRYAFSLESLLRWITTTRKVPSSSY